MNKKLIFVLSIFVVSIFAMSVQAEVIQTFDDVDSNHQYFKPIKFLKDNNVVIGFGDGTFHPDQAITRAEFMKIIILGSRLDIPKAITSPFSDVKLGEWYTDFIVFGAEKGYIQGYSDQTFRPDQAINKVEALKILGELVMWNFDSFDKSKVQNPFADTDINEWYGKYLAYAIDKNLLDDNEKNYQPGTPITRGQMTEYIFRDYVTRTLNTQRYDSKDGDQIFSEEPSATTTSCVSSKEALEKVKLDVVAKEKNKDHLRVFQNSITLKNGDEFEYFADGKIDAIAKKVNENQWFFWLDLAPNTKFEHDTKIVTVNTDDCQVNTYNSDLWPAINNKFIWATDTERDASPELVYWSTKAEAPGQIVGAAPVFGACNADVTKKKKAIVLYLGADAGIKMDAVNMYKQLCGNNYQTTVITGNDQNVVFQNIVNTLQAIADASTQPEGSLKNLFFYVSAHGLLNTGDLIVGTDVQKDAAGSDKVLAKIISLPFLTSAIGGISFSGTNSESFTVAHDTCYSGNVVPLYQVEAEDSGVAVGWVVASSDAASPSGSWSLSGGVLTSSLIKCTTSIGSHASFGECLSDEITKKLSGKLPNTSILEKLSTSTSSAVPFMP
jgi:hypothetical protein